MFHNRPKRTSCILGLEVNDNPSIPEENISQNKIVSFNASGEKTMEYEKSKLLPIIEESKYIEGNHILPIHTVYFGENQHCNVSVAIGNEAIDPVYLNQLPAETDKAHPRQDLLRRRIPRIPRHNHNKRSFHKSFPLPLIRV